MVCLVQHSWLDFTEWNSQIGGRVLILVRLAVNNNMTNGSALIKMTDVTALNQYICGWHMYNVFLNGYKLQTVIQMSTSSWENNGILVNTMSFCRSPVAKCQLCFVNTLYLGTFCWTFCWTKNHNVHRFTLNSHSLKIMIVKGFPANITYWGAVVFEKWVKQWHENNCHLKNISM